MKFARAAGWFGCSHLAVLLLATSCSKEPGPKVDTLSFPVVVLFGNAATRVCHTPAELTTMHTNYLVLNDTNPHLIDADLKVFEVQRLRSIHSGAWLMANPSGATEVTFELKPQKSGIEAARALFAQQLEKQTWLDDRAARRDALQKERALLGMAAAIDPPSR